MSGLINSRQRRVKLPHGPRLTIEVDDATIAASMLRDSSHCMIASALKQAVPDAKLIAVDLQTIRFSDGHRPLRYTYLTPRIAQLALIKFDQGDKDIEPFSFSLRGAQVTAAGQLRGKRRANSGAQKGVLTPSLMKARKVAFGTTLKHAQLRPDQQKGLVPDKIGGRTPPTTPFARRRAFGLRGLAL